MIYTKKDIEHLDRISRLKIINAVTGIKPANLIGSIRIMQWGLDCFLLKQKN